MNIHKVTDGKLIDVKKLSDKVFADKMLGDTIAYKSKDGIIYSPVDGNVSMIFPTCHAIGIKLDNGLEILIHIGINSVNLKGEGFKKFVDEGSFVKKGDKLIEVDLELLSSKNIDDSIIVILTNGGKFKTDIFGRVSISNE